VPIRAATQDGLPGVRWGRRGRVHVYGHGTGRLFRDAAALALQDGQRRAARQLVWHQTFRADNRPKPRVRKYGGRVSRYSDRLIAQVKTLMQSRSRLMEELFFRIGRPDTASNNPVRLYAVLRVVRDVVIEGAEDDAEGLAHVAQELDEDVTDTIDRQVSVLFGKPMVSAVPSVGAIEQWTRENVGLIKSIARRSHDEVVDVIQSGYLRGTPTKELAKEISRRFEISQSRGALIARDQTAKLSSRVNQERQESYGIERYMWSSSGDERVRQRHAELDGQIFSWSQPPIADERTGLRGHPGEVWQCLPGDSRVALAHSAVMAYRRWFDGELTEIITNSTEALRVTPNHPVLTHRGWVPAHLVQVGDYLLQATDQRAQVAESHVEHREPSIEQVFDALSLVGDPERARGGVMDFHGDGTHQEIDVVRIDWGLLVNGVSEFSKEASQLVLADADATLPGAGDMMVVLEAVGLPSNSFVRGASKILALLRGESRHPVEHGLGTISWLDALTTQLRIHGAASDAVALCKRLRALAVKEQGDQLVARVVLGIVRRAVGGLVGSPTSAKVLGDQVGVPADLRRNLGEGVPFLGQLVRVREKRVRVHAGHVYNLHTGPNWYIAGGVVVHNCRCDAEPILPDEDEREALAVARARKESELLRLQSSPVTTEIEDLEHWNKKRIRALKRGARSAVGL